MDHAGSSWKGPASGCGWAGELQGNNKAQLEGPCERAVCLRGDGGPFGSSHLPQDVGNEPRAVLLLL